MSARFAAANRFCASAVFSQELRFAKSQTSHGRGLRQPSNAEGTMGSDSWFRLFEVEEVHVAQRVAGKDQFERVGKCTADHGAIASEGGQRFSAREVPHLQRIVQRRGYRPLPVRRHRHVIDISGVAFQRAQRPGYDRRVLKNRNRYS